MSISTVGGDNAISACHFCSEWWTRDSNDVYWVGGIVATRPQKIDGRTSDRLARYISLEVSFHFFPLVDHLCPRFSLAVPLLFSFSMLSLMHLLVTLTLFTSVAWAVPVPAPGFLDDLGDLLGGKSKSGVAAISAVDLSSAFNRAAQFSRAVYCSTDSVTTLTCGAPCDALGEDVTFLLSGGGASVPINKISRWFDGAL